MLIRSQNKHSLINLDNIARLTVGKVYGKDETDWLVEVDKQPFTESLGQYSTEPKAIKVLDMIEDAYTNARDIQAFIDLGIPFEIISNKVFQMPSDEEMEG